MNDAPPSASTDADALLRLKRFGGSALLVQMIDLFLVAGADRVTAAREATERGDAAAAEMALHSLRSSAAQLGAPRMQQLSEHGELLARSGAVEELPPIVAELEFELERVTAWLTTMRTMEGA
jgi:HPt (histidine-containing phosphotransfer) domain-containing protein